MFILIFIFLGLQVPLYSGCREGEYVSNDTCKSCYDTCVSCSSEVHCTDCKDGFFGSACKDICPLNCTKCLSADVCISCMAGWTGSKCQKPCSKYCLRYNRPTSDNIQHLQLSMGEFDWCALNGTCLAGCVAGKHGSDCTLDCKNKEICLACSQFIGHCLRCTNGRYGSQNHCDKSCGHCKPDNHGVVQCDINTGKCALGCLDGNYLPSCEKKCGHCLQNDDNVVKCDMLTGYCEKGCISGWHGNTCKATCSFTCLNMSCDQHSGHCDSGCEAGWYSDTCNDTCSSTCFNKSCDRHSGHCDSGCEAGWYGDTCNETCTCTCFNKSCDQQSGFCDSGCMAGWYGDTCNETCSNTCSNKSCDRNSGRCEECVHGYYGNTCKFNCPQACNGHVCDRDSAKCLFGCTQELDGVFCNRTTHLFQTMKHDSDYFVVGFTGCLIGIAVSLVFIIVCCLIKSLTKGGKHYGHLDMSTRENVPPPIYDEIPEIDEAVDPQRGSGSHVYMDIGNACTVPITQDSATNTNQTGSYGATGSREIKAHASKNVLGTRKYYIYENDETAPVPAKANNTHSLHFKDAERNSSGVDENTSSDTLDRTEAQRENLRKSRKYYEIPDLPLSETGTKGDGMHRGDDYEVPVSGQNVASPEAHGANQSKRHCKAFTSHTNNQDENGTSALHKTKDLARLNDKIPAVNTIICKKRESDSISTESIETSGENCELISNTIDNPESLLNRSSTELQTLDVKQSETDGESESLNYLHPVS